MNLTLGADPELFLVRNTGGLVASCGMFGGTKMDPRRVPELGSHFALQEDNVALEYNIPPSATREAFTANMQTMLTYLQGLVKERGLAFSDLASASFPETELWHPNSRMFGCEPDYNAWEKGAVNKMPNSPDWKFRTCGGHVHVGHKFKSKKATQEFIQHLDLFLGVPSVLMDPDTNRRELYGKAGSFRYKPYGCEYRTLSNFWVLNPKMNEWVWDSVNRAADVWLEKSVDIASIGPAIQEAINNNNYEVAVDLSRQYGVTTV